MLCVPSNPASACEVGALEGFEIVRRRLFTPVKDETTREQTCLAYSRLYGGDSSDFPRQCAEAQYLERLRAAYPIHPEVFDRLYEDWASLERFQRTRGVLRLMAAAIHELECLTPFVLR
jgi:predicted AAA+ superfamily ATPase